MSKKIIIPLILITVLLVGSITLAFSYAMWNVTKEQTNENVVESGCLNLEIQNEENTISLNNAYPITDSEASRLVPYKFTIKNTCTIASKYTINLEMLSNTNLNLNYVATKIDNEEKRILGNITKNGERIINNSVASKTIKEGLLAPSKSVEIELRVWMNESVSLSDDAENKILNAKVVVIGETISDEYCQSIIGTIWNFEYVEDASGNGYGQDFFTFCDGNYKVELWGASGGKYNNSTPSGNGGYTSGQINIEKDNELTVYVGGAGVYTDSGISKAGYNGGSASGKNGAESTSGGGATDIRLIGGLWNNVESLNERIMVAAGGGGSHFSNKAGSGGGLIGYSAEIKNDTYGYALGATQISGGNHSLSNSWASKGTIGRSGAWNNNNGGGGGGYYGGMSGIGYNRSGSGGSSFISGHAGSVAITSKTDLTPRNDSEGISCGNSSSKGYNELGYNTDITCSYHYSGYKFTNTKMIDGEGYNWTTEKGEYVGQIQPDGTTAMGHSGNGYARITYLGNF